MVGSERRRTRDCNPKAASAIADGLERVIERRGVTGHRHRLQQRRPLRRGGGQVAPHLHPNNAAPACRCCCCCSCSSTVIPSLISHCNPNAHHPRRVSSPPIHLPATSLRSPPRPIPIPTHAHTSKPCNTHPRLPSSPNHVITPPWRPPSNPSNQTYHIFKLTPQPIPTYCRQSQKPIPKLITNPDLPKLARSLAIQRPHPKLT